MNDACRLEREVLDAAEHDRWTDALRAHLGACDDCAAAVAVAPWMDRFAAIPDREHILPHPSILWLKAQVMRNSADVARATRPMNNVQLVAYLVVASGWAALLTWKWSAVDRLIHTFSTSSLAAGDTPLSSLPTFSAVLLLATMTVTLALHTVLAEE
jgi:hypothetical protein